MINAEEIDIRIKAGTEPGHRERSWLIIIVFEELPPPTNDDERRYYVSPKPDNIRLCPPKRY
jgi:hypothetical protein